MLTKLFHKKNRSSECGIFLMEILVVICLLGLFGMAITKSNIVSLKMRKRAQIFSQANQLALDQLEAYAGMSISQIPANDVVNRTIGNTEYEILSTLTSSSDGSSTVWVDVSALSTVHPVSVSLNLVLYDN